MSYFITVSELQSSFFNLTFPDKALLTIKVNTVAPNELSVGLFMPLRCFCLHEGTEKFRVTRVAGKPGGVHGRDSATRAQDGRGGGVWSSAGRKSHSVRRQ